MNLSLSGRGPLSLRGLWDWSNGVGRGKGEKPTFEL